MSSDEVQLIMGKVYMVIAALAIACAATVVREWLKTPSGKLWMTAMTFRYRAWTGTIPSGSVIAPADEVVAPSSSRKSSSSRKGGVKFGRAAANDRAKPGRAKSSSNSSGSRKHRQPQREEASSNESESDEQKEPLRKHRSRRRSRDRTASS